MANLFTENKIEKRDRRKVQAENRQWKARKRAQRRKQRAEAWLNFQKQFRTFIANPFAKFKLKGFIQQQKEFLVVAKRDRKKIQAENRQWKARKRAQRRKQRDEAWLNFQKQFRTFIANPFAKRKLKGIKKQQKEFLDVVKRDRKLSRQKWQDTFYKNLLTIRASSDLKKKLFNTFLHSAAYFVLAFLSIYVVYQAATLTVAYMFHIPVEWVYYRLKFPLDTFSPLYSRPALIAIFAAGPFSSLILAFIFLKLFFIKDTFVNRFKLFYLWGFICGSNMFFGAYIAGFFTRTEFIYTTEWLFMSSMFDVEEIVFTVVSIVTLLVMARIVTPLFLMSSGSVTLLQPGLRFFFMISQVILPWLAGMLILFLITMPSPYIPLILKTITPGLILIPTLFFYDSVKFENIHKTGVIKRSYFRWSIIIAVIALLFFYRVILNIGIRIL
jgi:hypothetical protein